MSRRKIGGALTLARFCAFLWYKLRYRLRSLYDFDNDIKCLEQKNGGYTFSHAVHQAWTIATLE